MVTEPIDGWNLPAATRLAISSLAKYSYSHRIRLGFGIWGIKSLKKLGNNIGFANRTSLVHLM